MGKPYLTVEEEAIMLWSIQFVVTRDRPILPSQHTGRKIVDSQPVVGQIGGEFSRYSISGKARKGWFLGFSKTIKKISMCSIQKKWSKSKVCSLLVPILAKWHQESHLVLNFLPT